MPASLEAELRQRLARYLDGELALSAFLEWFTSHPWDAVLGGSTPAGELAHEIELRLAEYANGFWTREEFHALLRPLTEQPDGIDFGSARQRRDSAMGEDARGV